jgi:hypothetical protein
VQCCPYPQLPWHLVINYGLLPFGYSVCLFVTKEPLRCHLYSVPDCCQSAGPLTFTLFQI